VIEQGKLANSWRGATRSAQGRVYGIGPAIVEPSVSNMGYITRSAKLPRLRRPLEVATMRLLITPEAGAVQANGPSV